MVHHHTCWSCRGLVVGAVGFCPTCQAIQPPALELDFFQLFDLPFIFNVDLALLEQRYQALQRQFHPDRFVTGGPQARRFSLEQVTRLNQAYQTIRDPLARSQYLLERLGSVPPGADRNGCTAATDPVFLMELMEAREALAAIVLTSKAAAQQVVRLRQQTEERMAQERTVMGHLFGQCVADPLPPLLAQLAQSNDRYRYHCRFLEAVERAEETLYGG